MFSIGLYKVHIANLLVWNHLAYSLDNWYLYHLVDPSTRFVKIMPILPKWTHPGGHVFYIGFNRESIKNIHRVIASPSATLPSLFKLSPLVLYSFLQQI